jgi:hypothetical protein
MQGFMGLAGFEVMLVEQGGDLERNPAQPKNYFHRMTLETSGPIDRMQREDRSDRSARSKAAPFFSR